MCLAACELQVRTIRVLVVSGRAFDDVERGRQVSCRSYADGRQLGVRQRKVR
jgi:hypothetical protein